jgi:hypothetical protein
VCTRSDGSRRTACCISRRSGLSNCCRIGRDCIWRCGALESGAASRGDRACLVQPVGTGAPAIHPPCTSTSSSHTGSRRTCSTCFALRACLCHVKRPTCRCRLGVLTATSDGGLGVPLRESAIGRLRRAALVITQWLSSLQRQPQRQCQSGPAYPLLWRPSNVSSTIQLYAAGISAWSRRDEVK